MHAFRELFRLRFDIPNGSALHTRSWILASNIVGGSNLPRLAAIESADAR